MAKYNYLIEGISGSGKSTVGEELKTKGYTVIDADKVFGYYGDPKTGEPTSEKSQLNWLWEKNKVEQRLGSQTDNILFVCGGAMNQAQFEHYFSKIFMLKVDDETLKHRIMNRTSHDFGKDPEDLKRQLAWNKGVEEYAKQKGAILVDASKPVADVARYILKEVGQ
ncbi:AAA family ATPase [Candidatus Saccharibacteria bacterium]|nr:AAA family ATPase [Candidatus Saccharibacteria bacterium]